MSPKEFVIILKEYFEKNLIGTDKTEISKIDTEHPYNGPKGEGYCAMIKDTNTGMVFYPKSFGYIEYYEQNGPDSIKEIAKSINDMAAEFAEEARATAIPQPDATPEKIITTTLLTKNVPNGMQHFAMRELADVGITQILKAPVIGLEHKNVYTPLEKDKYYPNGVTDNDWIMGLTNTILKSSLSAEPILVDEDSVPLMVKLDDDNHFTEYFYLQIPLDAYAEFMHTNYMLICPINPYSCLIVRYPDKTTSIEEFKQRMWAMGYAKNEYDIPLVIYDKDNDKSIIFSNAE